MPLPDGAKLDEHKLKLQKIIGDASCLYHALLHLYLNPTFGDAPENAVYTTMTSARDIRNEILEYFVANPWLVEFGWFGQQSDGSSKESIENFKNRVRNEAAFGDARMAQLFSLMTKTVIHIVLMKDSNTISTTFESYYPCPSTNPEEAYDREQVERFPVLVLAYKSSGTGSDLISGVNDPRNHFDAIVKAENYLDGTIMYPLEIIMDDVEDFPEGADGSKEADSTEDVDADEEVDKTTTLRVGYNPVLELPSPDRFKNANLEAIYPTEIEQLSTRIQPIRLRIMEIQEMLKKDISNQELAIEKAQKLKEYKMLCDSIRLAIRKYEVNSVFRNFVLSMKESNKYYVDVSRIIRSKNVPSIPFLTPDNFLGADDETLDKTKKWESKRLAREQFYTRMEYIFRDFDPKRPYAFGKAGQALNKTTARTMKTNYLTITVKDPYCSVKIRVLSDFRVWFTFMSIPSRSTQAKTAIFSLFSAFETILKNEGFFVSDTWQADLDSHYDPLVMPEFATFNLSGIPEDLFRDAKNYGFDKVPKHLRVFRHSRMIGLKNWFNTIAIDHTRPYKGNFEYVKTFTIPDFGHTPDNPLCSESKRTEKRFAYTSMINPVSGTWLNIPPEQSIDDENKMTGGDMSDSTRRQQIEKGKNLTTRDAPNFNMAFGRFKYIDDVNKEEYDAFDGNKRAFELYSRTPQRQFSYQVQKFLPGYAQIFASGRVYIDGYKNEEDLIKIVRGVIYWLCFSKNDAKRTEFMKTVESFGSFIRDLSKNDPVCDLFNYFHGLQEAFEEMNDTLGATRYTNTHQTRKTKKERMQSFPTKRR